MSGRGCSPKYGDLGRFRGFRHLLLTFPAYNINDTHRRARMVLAAGVVLGDLAGASYGSAGDFQGGRLDVGLGPWREGG